MSAAPSEPESRSSVAWVFSGKALLGLGLVVCVVTALFLLPIDAYLQGFLAWIEGAGAWGPVLLAAAYVPATVLMIPGSVLTLGSGFAFGVVLGTVVVSIGSVLGSSIAFLLGRTLMRGWVSRQLAERPRLRAVDEAVAKDGFKIALLIRLSPAFPYNLMGYVFGVTRISFKDHLLASWIGMLPGTVLYVYLGCAGRHLAEAASGAAPARGIGYWAVWAGGLLATVLVTVYVTRIARRAIREAAPELVAEDSAVETSEAPAHG